MHPTLARYLNIDAALDTLTREDQGQVLRAEERPLVRAAHAAPEKRALITSARGAGREAPDVQHALLFLAAHAAALALAEETSWGPALTRARSALEKEGASDEQIDLFIASLLLEEAFGYDESPDIFDDAFFAETLQSVPGLAQLTAERVEGLRAAFVKTGQPDWRGAYATVAEALLQAAWQEGPQPVNPEHVQDALAAIEERYGKVEAARNIEALRRFLSFLGKAGFLGPMRTARLERVVNQTALGVPGPSV